MPSDDVRLSVTRLFKRYGAAVALRGMDFRLGVGEIVAVVGENGAGKSTFAKIIGGAIRPDAGSIALDGVVIQLHSPRDAILAGISYIPQELSYLPNMTVADNLLVGRWPSRFGTTNRPSVAKKAEQIAQRFGIRLDVRQSLAELSLAEKQLVDILKCLARDAKVLILDEPTASLTSDESKNLFRVLRNLACVGVGMVFVSHRLDEVFEIADRIVVLRNGAVVADLRPQDVGPRELIEHMLGSHVARAEREIRLGHDAEPGALALRVRDWGRRGMPNISGLSFDLREGEILGLFGQRGSGAGLVADGLGGRMSDFTGHLDMKGTARAPFSTPRESLRAGIGYIPPERKRDGLVLQMSIQQNLSMLAIRKVAQLGVLRRHRERRQAEVWREKLQIRCQTVAQTVDSLSGGNQQKTLLASRLVAHPRVLVLNEPTRGVDVGARAEIHRYLIDQAEQGAAVLWVTSDVEEAVLISDRLLVMRDGAIMGELRGAEKTQRNALTLATGDVHDTGRAS